MNILILGSRGIIGASLKELLGKDNKISEYDRKINQENDLRIKAPDMSNFDFVFFLAYDVGGAKYLKEQSLEFINNNVKIMDNVFHELKRTKVPFIFASSQMQNMENPYGALKRLGEQYTKILGGISIRFCNVYDYEEVSLKSHVIVDFISQKIKNNKIELMTNGNEMRQFLHSQDCAKALKIVMENYKTMKKTIDITNFEWICIKDLAGMICDNIILGSDNDIQTIKNEPDPYILDFWKPEITLQQGIEMISQKMKEKITENVKENVKEIPIFIVHYKKLTERKKYLESAFKKEGLTNIHWIDNIDRDTMTEEQLNMYQYNPDQWYKLNATWKQYSSKPRLLTKPEIACTVSHIVIYKYIIDNSLDKAIIFEDDCILYPNFVENLSRVLKELPDDFDACYFNDAFGWTVENNHPGFLSKKHKYTPDKCVYLMNYGKCGDSFLLSNKAAKILYENFIPFSLPPDWMQTPIYLKNNMKIYWSQPALTHQGSEDVYQSSVKRDENEHTQLLKLEEQKLLEIKNTDIKDLLNKVDINHYKKFNKEFTDNTYAPLEQYAKDRLEEFTERLKTGNNFSIFRYGDGELRNMTSVDENNHNCDGCFYYKDLGSDLIKSYIYSLTNDMAYINRWHSHTYDIQHEIEKNYSFDSERKFLFFDLMTHKLIKSNNQYSIDGFSFKDEQIQFFRTIKFINRRKIYISNQLMIGNVGKLLNTTVGVIVPDRNCYLEKTNIIGNICNFLNENPDFQNDTIFLFSCGMAAKVFAYEISMKYPNNTFIDIGSTMDGLIKQSRDFNGTELYRDILLKCYGD